MVSDRPKQVAHALCTSNVQGQSDRAARATSTALHVLWVTLWVVWVSGRWIAEWKMEN